ncbi:MAG TPA: SH3 domain-containing protein [Vicinamibacterales bacterium]|nr:SH3 domain-containing protein [Vicinamibacterales bacterium]
MNRIVLVVVCLLVPVLAAAQQESRVRVTRAMTVTEQPEGNAGVVATLNVGDVLEVLDQRNGWLLVRPPAGSTQTWRTGWVNAASTQPIGAIAATSSAAPAVQEPAARGGRKGFVIGLGGGFGMHQYTTPSFTVRNVTFGGESLTSSGLATEFLIGYAPTDRLLIYYENSLQLTGDLAYDVLGLTGAGATYLFNPLARSWYVRGAVGAAVGADVDLNRSSASSVERGLAFSFGGGYEFARHWLLGGSVMMLKLDNVTHRAYKGTITWVFY